MFNVEICNQGEVVPETFAYSSQDQSTSQLFYLGQEVQNELGQAGFSLECSVFCFHLSYLSYFQPLVTFIPFCSVTFFFFLRLDSYLSALPDYIWGSRSPPLNQSIQLLLLCL